MALKSLFRTKTTTTATGDSRDYIDLEELASDAELTDATASMMVRVGEINRYEDLREFANYVYQGNLLLLDFSGVAKDEVILRRVTQDLKKLVTDINGDIAGLGKTMMIVAPTGVKIDRQKARGGN